MKPKAHVFSLGAASLVNSADASLQAIPDRCLEGQDYVNSTDSDRCCGTEGDSCAPAVEIL